MVWFKMAGVLFWNLPDFRVLDREDAHEEIAHKIVATLFQGFELGL